VTRREETLTVRCPHCGADDDRVVDSRAAEDGAAVRRRRQCVACQQRFSTYERAEELGLVVRKRDGSLEPYERQKVLDGMRRALGSDVGGGVVRAAAEQVESRLHGRGSRHVPSSAIGTEVVTALRDVSPPAAIRFASVHQGFTSTDDFRRALADLEEPDSAGDAAAGDE
jgi:transcriptional repressor NrdR